MRRLASSIRQAEDALFVRYAVPAEHFHCPLPTSGEELRVWRWGTGEPVVLLHAAGLPGTSWVPVAARQSDVQVHLIELSGHGLAGTSEIEPSPPRRHGHNLLCELLDELSLTSAHVVGNSLGGALGLWFAASAPERVRSFTAMDVPAPALPGITVPPVLSLMMLRGIGPLMQRIPAPSFAFRVLISQILGRSDAANAPQELIEIARLSSRQPGNVRTLTNVAAQARWTPETASRIDTQHRRTQIGSTAVPVSVGQQGSDHAPRPSPTNPGARPRGDHPASPGGHAPWLTSPEQCAEFLMMHVTHAEHR